MVLLPSNLLQDALSTLEVLNSIFPLTGELTLTPETTSTLAFLRSYLDSPSSPPPSVFLASLTALVHIQLDPPPGAIDSDQEQGWCLVGQVDIPIAVEQPSQTTISLLQPTWISDDDFTDLKASLPPIDAKDDPTSTLLDLAEVLRRVGPRLIPLAPPSSSVVAPAPPRRNPAPADSQKMPLGKEAILCLSKMHHISNQPKLRKLKALAIENGVSGYVKSGKPGILLYEMESEETLQRFLKGVRSLNYLEWHHLASTPLLPPLNPSSSSLPSSSSSTNQTPSQRHANELNLAPRRLNDGKIGLVELVDTKELVGIAERLGRKDWFRLGMGMTGGG